MRSFKKIQVGLVAMAAVGLLMPPRAFSASADPTRSATLHAGDVELGEGGILRGHVVDAQGNVLANQEVWVVRNNEAVGQTRTDAGGYFQFRGLASGLYQVRTETGVSTYRVWMPRTAPPSATAQALVVHQPTVRGQGKKGLCCFLCNPWVLGGIAAAAIAIPLALDDDRSS